jgi:hypothetical protein
MAVDGLAVHQLQHQVGLAAGGDAGVEQPRDVRVRQPRQDAAFALEALAGLGAVKPPVHQLDGGLAFVAAVAAPRQPHSNRTSGALVVFWRATAMYLTGPQLAAPPHQEAPP